MQPIPTPLALVGALPLSAELAPPQDGPQVWPSPTRTGSWLDLEGRAWHRRGKEQSLTRLDKLILDVDVPVVVLYSFEVRVVPDAWRVATAAMLKAHWRAPNLESVAAAEFKNDNGERLVVLEVSC